VLSLRDALETDNILAYEWNGRPLPGLHGFPPRAVIPGRNGDAWVKWLLEIVVE
jgi:sulfite oxidase